MRRDTRTLEGLLDRLCERANEREVPTAVCVAARDATSRRFASVSGGGPLDEASAFRVRSYFSAVVRRKVVRGSEGRRAASRIVLATVANDLLESGRSGASVAEHLARAWEGSVPADVLEEVRLQLVG